MDAIIETNESKGKTCSRCGVWKEWEQFPKQKGNKDGYRAECKQCRNEAQQKSRYIDIEATRAKWRLYYYQLTDARFKALLRQQQYRCAVCCVLFTSEIKPYVDHNHLCCPGQKSCGECVRGLLCKDCNSMLGKVNDSADIFQRAIDYVNGKYKRKKRTIPACIESY